ncbi:hypothetical protein EC396_14015 [Lutibacter sp. HS1-25]|nr:hypothetical protein EC396_14015 [Lutibacter sp. HS1-25]
MGVLLSKILEKLPVEDATDYRSQNKILFQQLNKTSIVIDDDPTGNQTVYNVPLLTTWDVNALITEFKKETPIFFLLTNSRSLTVQKSSEIYNEIAKNITEASKQTGRDFSVISRSDSTLRGHFPSEINAIKQESSFQNSITVFIPVMFEGGRVTVNNIHYLLENENLIPVNETPFAQDHSFGYSKANLKEWIEEKSSGKVKACEVFSISIEEIRNLNVTILVEKILNIHFGKILIFNALNYDDLDKVANVLLLAEKRGKQIIYRTSSSFVPSYIGLNPKSLLSASQLIGNDCKTGGLTIVGSYVPKSSSQLKKALDYFKNEAVFEIDVEALFNKNSIEYLENLATKISEVLEIGEDVLVFTSRKLITGKTIVENLNIGEIVSNALVQIVRKLKVKPKYLIAKGGITSHDLAIKGLDMKRSKVIGQILPGIPVWEMGIETKFPDLSYIVFPGNVGDEKSLLTIIQKLT